MKSINRGEIESHIESVTVEFLDTEESIQLFTRQDSACHFFERFRVGAEELQLRLDWSDIDLNGNPTLDADFYNPQDGKKRRLNGERGEAHHTKSRDGNARSYMWKFKNCQRPFEVLVNWLGNVSFNVKMGIQSEAEIIKGNG